MFTNYSQTYAAAILTLAGLIVSVLAAFGIDLFSTDEVSFIIGSAANLIGIIWAIFHRKSKGDVTVLGRRK